MRRFENKNVVVTGGADGIGKAAVERFFNEGANVIIWDMSAEKGESLAAQLHTEKQKVVFEKVNTAVFNEVENASTKAIAQFGQIHVLINNAGITRDASIKKMTVDQWQQVIDVNLSGVFYCAKSIGLHMAEKGYGRIINTSSVVGLYGNFGQSNYVAAKAGVIGMTKTIGRELGRKGVTVNAVAPGFIATEMVKKMPENILQGMCDKTPVGRLGTPEEIAATYAFLASDDAAFINCAVISVDGGITV